MIPVNFVGGPWHGKQMEMDDPPPHWRVEDMRGDGYPRTTLYRSLDWRDIGGVMFWPGTITYTAPDVEMITQARRHVFYEDEIAVLTLEGAKNRARDRLQLDMDGSLYEHAPLSPILRDEQLTVAEFDGQLFTCRAMWLYRKEAK